MVGDVDLHLELVFCLGLLVVAFAQFLVVCYLVWVVCLISVSLGTHGLRCLLCNCGFSVVAF